MSELTRRQFLGATAAAGAGMLMTGCLAQDTRPAGAAAADLAGFPTLPPAKIYKVFAGRTGDSYLTHPTEEIGRFNTYLAELEKRLGDVQFIGGDLVPPANVDEVAAKIADADGLLIIHLSGHGGDAPVLTKLIDVGLPTTLFSQPFSGHGWMYFPQWHKQGKKVVLMPSSNWADLDQVIGLMRVPARMKQTRILAINGPNGTPAACSPEAVKKKLGADLVIVPNARVMELFKSIDDKAAEAEAQAYWLGPTREIVEPKRPEIVDSARLFLATKKLMIEEKAQAVCSRACMGTPRGCFTFSKLNDLGFVGACEGDIDSTLTMLLFAYAFRVPGFISDPVIDTAKNAMVHFHCTSATRMDGPGGKRLPFRIRSQTDSRGGAALEVENRVGQPVTCAKLVNLDTMLMVTGKIIETSRSPLACRTQFAQSVPDARRLFLNWGADVIKGDTMTLLHRVVFYGDYGQPMQTLRELMGFKVIEEGGAA
jgi:hypothetical protein